MLVTELVFVALAALAGPIAAALAVYFLGRRMGYGPLVSDLREQRGQLVVTLKDRVQALEDERDSLRLELEAERQRVSTLEREKEALAARIDVLEQVLGDLAAEGKIHVRARDDR